MTPQMMTLGAVVLFILLLLAIRYEWIGNLGALLGGIVAVVFVIFGMAILFSLPVMWLWDYTMPNLFGVPEITLGRAFCLVLLCKMLFGSSSSKSKD